MWIWAASTCPTSRSRRYRQTRRAAGYFISCVIQIQWTENTPLRFLVSFLRRTFRCYALKVYSGAFFTLLCCFKVTLCDVSALGQNIFLHCWTKSGCSRSLSQKQYREDWLNHLTLLPVLIGTSIAASVTHTSTNTYLWRPSLRSRLICQLCSAAQRFKNAEMCSEKYYFRRYYVWIRDTWR